MNLATPIAICSTVLLAALSVRAQTNFQDLDFESATLSPVPPNQPPTVFVPISSALPGWSASIGDVPTTQIQQNSYDTGQATIDIFGPNYPAIGYGLGFGQGTIDGNYTAFLQSGGNPIPNGQGVNVSISQIGTVPANAQSLEFKAWTYAELGAFSGSFDGNSLSPVVLSSTQTPVGIPVIEYGVNVAPYAGQTGQLEFTAIYTGAPSWTGFDDITFSPMAATPEPNTLALVIMGGLALAARRWRSRKK